MRTHKAATDFEYWRHIVGTQNARYMRYGPEMLEQLQSVAAWLIAPSLHRATLEQVQADCMAIIAKAEGKTP